MRYYNVLILSICLLLTSCDDGDIIVTSFDFEEQNLQYCEGASSLVFLKINNSTQESIAFNLNQDPLFLENTAVTQIQLNTSNFVIYRSFNANVTASYFCSSIPPTQPTITLEFTATEGTAQTTVVNTLDDNDGVDEMFEVDENSEEEQDTDNDGLPDFYDLDDDGDNVPTSLEINNDDGDDNPFTNPLDTDGDGIPNFLDDDDDGDGVLTRNESSDGDSNPSNDITDAAVGPDYLNPDVTNEIIINEYRQHTFTVSSTVSVLLQNITFVNNAETIREESIDLGDIIDVINRQESIIPEFIIN